MTGIWFESNKRYYIVGAGIHQKRFLADSSWEIYAPGTVTFNSSSSIRGKGVNDVLVAGSFGEIAHYNGVTWQNYRNRLFFSGAFAGVQVKRNLMIAVGFNGTKAIAVKIKR